MKIIGSGIAIGLIAWTLADYLRCLNILSSSEGRSVSQFKHIRKQTLLCWHPCWQSMMINYSNSQIICKVLISDNSSIWIFHIKIRTEEPLNTNRMKTVNGIHTCVAWAWEATENTCYWNACSNWNLLYKLLKKTELLPSSSN